MQVLKFGGTSVANAENISKVVAIVKETIKKDKTIVVVSALGGVTDLLLSAAASAAFNKRSVIPPRADTTTIVLSFLIVSFTMATTFEMFSALATDVPPNFKTCILFC